MAACDGSVQMAGRRAECAELAGWAQIPPKHGVLAHPLRRGMGAPQFLRRPGRSASPVLYRLGALPELPVSAPTEAVAVWLQRKKPGQ